jgi:NAD+ diphosphatase
MQLPSIYNRYVSGLNPVEGYEGDTIWFIFNQGKLLINVIGENIQLPCCRKLEEISVNIAGLIFLGIFDNQPCYAAETEVDTVEPAGMEFRALRSLFGFIETELFLLAGRALHLLYWSGNHRFCGRCGGKTSDKSDERAKICPKCGFVTYPRISPAIIVAVTKGNQILLAHAKHFAEGMYSVIAGFVEPGETFEDCVKREVMEEVGIKVKNLEYFGSQPWPFPDSLMVGFTAEYESGEICVDGVEIGDAGWFRKDELPQIPSKMSIAGRMIRAFIENC